MSDNPTTSSDTARDDSTQRGADDECTTGDATTGSNRRRFLLGVGAATALVAGCVGGDDGGDDSSGNGDDAGGNGDDSGSDDNGDDGGVDDESDDGSSDDGMDDESDDGSSDDGSSDDGTGDDGGSDDGSSDDGTGDDGGSDDGSSDDGSSDDGSSDDGTGDDGGSDDGSDDGDPPSDEELAQQFAETMAWDEGDDWRMVWTDENQGVEGEYHYHGDDFYVRVEAPDGTVEWYLVDDTYYFVTEQGGQCFKFDGGFSTVPGPEEGGAIDAEEQYSDPDPDNIPEIEECGTDNIDGDPVTCWEVTAPSGETVRYYLLDSGRPRRIEAVDQGFVIDFFDWGNTDPISPPDMECESYGG